MRLFQEPNEKQSIKMIVKIESTICKKNQALGLNWKLILTFETSSV